MSLNLKELEASALEQLAHHRDAASLARCSRCGEVELRLELVRALSEAREALKKAQRKEET